MRCFRPATVQDVVQKLQVVREVLHVEFCSREYKTIRSISNAVSAYFWEGRRGEWGHQVTKKIKLYFGLPPILRKLLPFCIRCPQLQAANIPNVSRRWAYGSSCSSCSSCNNISVVPFLSKSKSKPFHFLTFLNFLSFSFHFCLASAPGFAQRWRGSWSESGTELSSSRVNVEKRRDVKSRKTIWVLQKRKNASSLNVYMRLEGLFEALGA